MSWIKTLSEINTVLNAADVVINAGNYRKLSQLQQQGAEAAMITDMLRQLKGDLFNLRQSAKEIAEMHEQQPRIAAVAAIMLEHKLADYPIAPEVFTELNDKEYAAETIKVIHRQSQDFVAQLPQEDQGRVRHIVQRTIESEESDYYIDHYRAGKAVLEAKATLTKNNCTGNANEGCLGLVIAVVLFFVGGSITSIYDFAENPLGVIMMIVAAIVFFSSLVRGSTCKSAKKELERYENQVDISTFSRLHKRFEGNTSKAKSVRALAQHELKEFLDENQKIVQIQSGHVSDPVTIQPPAAVMVPRSKDDRGETVSSVVDSDKYCMYCGKKIGIDAIFCPYCGRNQEE